MYLSTLTKFSIATLTKKNTPLLVFIKILTKKYQESMHSICEKSCYNMKVLLKDFTCSIYVCVCICSEE